MDSQQDQTPIIPPPGLREASYDKAMDNYINHLISKQRNFSLYNLAMDVLVVALIVIGMLFQLESHVLGIIVLPILVTKQLILWYIETYQ